MIASETETDSTFHHHGTVRTELQEIAPELCRNPNARFSPCILELERNRPTDSSPRPKFARSDISNTLISTPLEIGEMGNSKEGIKSICIGHFITH
jgi:hypothetical protein